MGIQGLLPLLKSIMVPIHIKDLEGSSVAVDAYSWLHKGAFSCSTQLCKRLPTTRHIEYCMHRVNLLRHYGVKPILVFDGGFLPMKIEQENKRARTRKENLARAIEHESNGNSAAAYECYQKAVDISPSIAHELIQVLKQENVSYIVAPYEADAQMTFLAVNKYVDAVITEDSDLIPFGCPRIIFKMDKYGQGVEFQYTRLHQNKELSFTGFSNQMLLEMCILSGCDYLPSLPGMGLKRAHALISRFKNYDKVIKHLKYSTVSVPPDYEESFKKAIFTFHHQRVYDPNTKDTVHLSEITKYLSDDLDFLGPLIPQHIAKGIAEGDLDPLTQAPFQVESSSAGIVSHRTSESKNVKPEIGRKKLDLPVQKNLLTKYFCFASVEAKRNFRAPRISPTNPALVDISSLTPGDNCIVKAAGNVNHSSASPLDYGNGGIIHHNNSIESNFASKAHDHSEPPTPEMAVENVNNGSLKHTSLQQFGHSIHNSQALLKECDFKDIQSDFPVDMRTENKKDMVRSSYVQLKSVKKNDQQNVEERLPLGRDDICNDLREDNVLKSSYRTRTSDEKIVVRSTYFRHKSENKNFQDRNQERLFANDDVALADEDFIHKNASDSKYSDAIAMKRKASVDDTDQRVLHENIKPKTMRKSNSITDSGCSPSDGETFVETKTEEGKFGSDVSHLSRYSDIAEKSMEKFVSVISSFRYSSSGSRASGLRAPLKNIRNTCENRSNVAVDFSRFAYAPKNSKSAAASGRVMK